MNRTRGSKLVTSNGTSQTNVVCVIVNIYLHCQYYTKGDVSYKYCPVPLIQEDGWATSGLA